MKWLLIILCLCTEAHATEIVEFRSRVDKSAYTDTLRLCQAYRKVKGYPDIQHGQFLVTESAEAWARILGYGLYDAHNSWYWGQKVTYIETVHLGFFDPGSWKNSLYFSFLVSSEGFFRASLHCLMDQMFVNGEYGDGKIREFADTLALADSIGSGLGHSAVVAEIFIPLMPLAKLGLLVTKFQWLQKFATRIENLPWEKVEALLIKSGVVSGIIVGDNLGCQIKRQELLGHLPLPLNARGTSKVQRFASAGQTFEALQKANTSCAKKLGSTEATIAQIKTTCNEDYRLARDLVKQFKIMENLNLYTRDLDEALKSREMKVVNRPKKITHANDYYCEIYPNIPTDEFGSPDMEEAYIGLLRIILPALPYLE